MLILVNRYVVELEKIKTTITVFGLTNEKVIVETRLLTFLVVLNFFFRSKRINLKQVFIIYFRVAKVYFKTI